MFQIDKTVDIKHLKVLKQSSLLYEEPHIAHCSIYKSHNVNNNNNSN